VPVDAIAEDLLGLLAEEGAEMGVSGLLVPAERRVLVNAAEPPARWRFTLATRWSTSRGTQPLVSA
jgi:hypothetical protein